MIPDLYNIQIYVRPGVTDMKKQVNGPPIITQEELMLNPGSGCLFLFCSRNRKLTSIIRYLIVRTFL